MRAILAGSRLTRSGESSRPFKETTSVPRWVAMTWRMASRSMTPKSWRIWMTGLPVRLNSPRTSSNCKSSILLCSLISDRSGLDRSSDITDLAPAFDQGAGISTDRLGQLQFLQFGLDGDRVLGFGDDFLAGDHSGQVFIDQKTVQRHHAVFGAGLDVGLDAERFIVANQGGDGGSVDHD